MASGLLGWHESVDVEAEVGLGDTIKAALWMPPRRALKLLPVPATFLAAWLMGYGFGLYGLAAAAALAVVAHAAVIGLVLSDYRKAGSKPARLRYHVCATGVEVRDPSQRQEWIPWDEMREVRETPSSFLLRPTQVEQFVIPKRFCGQEGTERIRDLVRDCHAPARAAAAAGR